MARSSPSRSRGGRDHDEPIASTVDRKVAAAAAKTEAKLGAAEAKLDAKVAAELAAAEATIDAKTAAANAKVAAADAKVRARQARATTDIDEKSGRLADKVGEKAAKLADHAARGAAALDRVAERLDALDLWTRSEPGARKPHLGRAELAGVAIRVADAEGIDAVSMRRIATELDVGTMTLYHYVRTKDELLALMVDELLGEIVVPDRDLPDDWQGAMTMIAIRSRDTLRRHPWVLDISTGPTIGPNAMRHFDQSWQAVAGLDSDVDTKLDVITAVDEYVFGFCLEERRSFADDERDPGMIGYLQELLVEGDYPALRALTAELGLAELWSRMETHAADAGRFGRNLARLLAGFRAGVGEH
jgi:AcrR family transcriptional regulator